MNSRTFDVFVNSVRSGENAIVARVVPRIISPKMSTQRTRFSVQRSTSRRSSVVLKTKTDNLDEVLHAVGECSHYQMRRHLLFFVLSIPFACQTLLVVFAGYFPGMCMETGPKKCELIDILNRQKACKFAGQTQFRFLQQELFSIVTEVRNIFRFYYLIYFAFTEYYIFFNRN